MSGAGEHKGWMRYVGSHGRVLAALVAVPLSLVTALALFLIFRPDPHPTDQELENRYQSLRAELRELATQLNSTKFDHVSPTGPTKLSRALNATGGLGAMRADDHWEVIVSSHSWSALSGTYKGYALGPSCDQAANTEQRQRPRYSRPLGDGWCVFLH